MTDELKPCPFGSKGKTEIEGKGQIWRGVKGYSDPQYFQLCHHGRLHDSDTFPTVFVEIRARTEEQAREMWNTRADLATPAPAVKVKALVWQQGGNNRGIAAVTVVGQYAAGLSIAGNPLWAIHTRGSSGYTYHYVDSFEAAKAAAQADYEARIMSALEPANPLDDPRVKALVVEALKEAERMLKHYGSRDAGGIAQIRAAISALEKNK